MFQFDDDLGLYSIHYDDGDQEEGVNGATLIRLLTHLDGPTGNREGVEREVMEEETEESLVDVVGAFREYAIPAVEGLVDAVQVLRSFADDPSNSIVDGGSFDPLEEMLRLVPICWQHTEKLLSLAQEYRLPSGSAPKNVRARALSFIPRALDIANTKVNELNNCVSLSHSCALVVCIMTAFPLNPLPKLITS